MEKVRFLYDMKAVPVFCKSLVRDGFGETLETCHTVDDLCIRNFGGRRGLEDS